jgi:hypothetical protein
MATKKATPAAKTNVEVKEKTKKATVKISKTTKSKAVISDEEIRRKAEEIYNARVKSGTDGDHMSDWLKAEELLRSGK